MLNCQTLVKAPTVYSVVNGTKFESRLSPRTWMNGAQCQDILMLQMLLCQYITLSLSSKAFLSYHVNKHKITDIHTLKLGQDS